MSDNNQQRRDGAESEPLYPEYVGLKSLELARIQKTLDEQLDALKSQTSDLQKRYDYVRQAMLPTAMDNEGLEKFTAEGVGTVYLAADMWVKVQPGQDKPLKEWLSNNGHGDLIKETVNASSLKAAIKEMLTKGEVVPDVIVKITPYTRACILKR